MDRNSSIPIFLNISKILINNLSKTEFITSSQIGIKLFYRELMCPTDNLPYEKVGKNEPVGIADEVPFDIPESWEWVRISSLGSIVRGSGIKRTETVESGKPCVRYGELYTTYHTSFNLSLIHI